VAADYGYTIPKVGDLVRNRKGIIGLVIYTQLCHFDGWKAEMCYVMWPNYDQLTQSDPLGLQIVSHS